MAQCLGKQYIEPTEILPNLVIKPAIARNTIMCIIKQLLKSIQIFPFGTGTT